MMDKTLYVNLAGGPGSGKSTTAAGTFAICKLAGLNVELITEYAKDLVWARTQVLLQNQISVFGQQLQRAYRLDGQVSAAITDSPLLLSCIYGDPNPELDALVIKTFKSYNNLNFFINRVKPYNPKGRNQDEAGARLLDQQIKDMFDTHKIPYIVINGDENAMCTIAAAIYKHVTNGGILESNLTVAKRGIPIIDETKTKGGTTC